MGKALIIGAGSASQSFGHTLRRAGYETVSIEQRHLRWPGLNPLRRKSHDVLLVEEDDVVADGTDRLPALRHLTAAPIIVIGPGEEKSVINALLQGADAYLSCSASDEMLLAQVNALMRRHPQPSNAF